MKTTDGSTVSELVSAETLAKLLDISMPTLRRWTKAGVIPAPFRVGRRLLKWRLADITEWIQNQHTGQETEQ